jgi:hypothetical protein
MPRARRGWDAGLCVVAFPGGLLAWRVAPPRHEGGAPAGGIAGARRSRPPTPRQARATVPEGGVPGPRPLRGGYLGGGGVGGPRPGRREPVHGGFSATSVSPKPGRRPPTPPPRTMAGAAAEGPARHRHQESRPQRRHHTATPQPPANAHESQRRHPPSQQAARKRATSYASDPTTGVQRPSRAVRRPPGRLGSTSAETAP